MNENESKERIVALLKEIVNDLVSGDISKIVSANRVEEYLTEKAIREELEDYPGFITIPPEGAYHKWDETIYLYKINGKHYRWENGELKKRFPRITYAVDFELFFDNEISDLTLQCNVYEDEHGNWSMKIENIHVL